METISLGLVWYAVFLFSIVFHEFAHSLMSFKLGDSTAFHAGQVTLDPIPHIKRELFGTTIVPIISYAISGWMIGWASAPYDPHWAYDNPKKSAWVSFAGPLANLGLVIITMIIIRLGIFIGFFISPDTLNFTNIVESANGGVLSAFALFLSILFSLNVMLFLFNLLPIPPLDGSGMIPFFVNEEKSRHFMEIMYNSPIRYVGLFIAWKLFDAIYPPFHFLIVNILYPGMYS